VVDLVNENIRTSVSYPASKPVTRETGVKGGGTDSALASVCAGGSPGLGIGWGGGPVDGLFEVGDALVGCGELGTITGNPPVLLQTRGGGGRHGRIRSL